MIIHAMQYKKTIKYIDLINYTKNKKDLNLLSTFTKRENLHEKPI